MNTIIPSCSNVRPKCFTALVLATSYIPFLFAREKGFPSNIITLVPKVASDQAYYDPVKIVLEVISILNEKLSIFRPFYTLAMHKWLTYSSSRAVSCCNCKVNLYYSHLEIEATFDTKFIKIGTKNSVPTHDLYRL